MKKIFFLLIAFSGTFLLTLPDAASQEFNHQSTPTALPVRDTIIKGRAVFIPNKAISAKKTTGDCSRSSDIYQTFFKKQDSYVPEDGFTSPLSVIKKIKIRFVVLEKDNTGRIQQNFRPSDSEDLYRMVGWLNDMMSTLRQPTNPFKSSCGNCYIKDERIRVELTGIDFIQDSTKYRYPKNTYLLTKRGKYSDSIINIYLYVDSSRWRPKIRPDFFTAGAWSSFGGELTGPDNSNVLSIFMFNTYLTSKIYPLIDTAATFNGTLWHETLRLMHELHHCLGLGHLQKDKSGNYGFDPGGCSGPDFLYDAFPDGCPMSYTDFRTNNLMNTSGAGLEWSNYLSPLQIGRANRSTFLGIVSKYAYPSESPSLHPFLIHGKQTWDFPIRIFQNIIIKKNAALILTCELQMPKGAAIIIKKGGKLIIQGGQIRTY